MNLSYRLSFECNLFTREVFCTAKSKEKLEEVGDEMGQSMANLTFHDSFQ